jgi:pimeloyl-ACP methyl ester carboxylesterase
MPPPLYGFPVLTRTNTTLKLAYYSSHGDVTAENDSSQPFFVDTVLVFVHGALRNADDYFCTAQSAADAAAAAVTATAGRSILRGISGSTMMPDATKARTWVIAPLFAHATNGTPSSSDEKLILINGGTALRWGDDVSNPWRSGANALGPNLTLHQLQQLLPNADDHDYSLSSYHALDMLLSWLVRKQSVLPSLKRIVVAGHSSGGQYVQRWSMLTPVWEDVAGEELRTIDVRGVVANPSSYAYLTPLRWEPKHRSWSVPDSCPLYDRWQWGLEDDPPGNHDPASFSNSYVRHQLRRIGGIEELIERFRHRRVIYLAGSQDRCNVTGADHFDDSGGGRGWCDSHGLETTCMDLLQGPTRWDRFQRFLASLKLIQVEAESYVVDGVGHDHSLMFQSPEGLRALFGATIDSTSSSGILGASEIEY